MRRVMIVVFAIVVLCVFATVSAQDDADICPSEIAYLSSTEGLPSLYLMNGDGTTPRLFAEAVSDFDWSPDGTRIVFTSFDEATRASVIKTIDFENRTITEIIRGQAQSFSPHWSPDGTRIAFNGGVSDYLQVFVVDSSGENLQQVTFDAVDHFIGDWSPDGTQLAMLVYEGAGSRIAVVDAVGGEVRYVTDLASGIYDEFAGWTPDGGSILFNSNRSGDSSLALHIVFLDNAVYRRLVGQYVYGLTWSSDGTRFVFMSREFNNAYVNLFMMNWQTGEIAQITEDSTIQHENFFIPSLSSDNSQIVFEAYEGGNYDIYTIGVDGGNFTRITDSPQNNTSPRWRPCFGN